jgi:hypothetical protein
VTAVRPKTAKEIASTAASLASSTITTFAVVRSQKRLFLGRSSRADGQISTNSNVARRRFVKPFPQKYSAFQNIRNILYLSLSRPTKGALRNVINAGRDAVDADGASDEGT